MRAPRTCLRVWQDLSLGGISMKHQEQWHAILSGRTT